MKQYKSIRRMPFYKAGTKFYLKTSGLYSNDGHLVFTKSELDLRPDVLEDWFEEVIDFDKKPALDTFYCFISGDGILCSATWEDDEIDNRRYELGNIYWDDLKASKEIDRIKAKKVLLKDANYYVPEKLYEPYYGVLFSISDDELFVAKQVYAFVGERQIYFQTEEEAKQSIDTHKDEWIKYLKANTMGGTI